jgi:hypothetical protein
MTVARAESRADWNVTARHALRRLSAVTWAGALLGLLVGGVGGRLAMMLLARLNPEATGMTSDDGFTIGHLSPLTLNLLVTATLLGVFGGGIYFVLRGLMIGPRWFQVLSISVGSAVVVGSVLVHVDGVDFTLEPAWLAIALFVVIPGAYAALLTVVAERWLHPGGRFMTSSFWLAVSPLLLWTPILPLLGALLIGLLVFAWVRRTPRGEVVLSQPAWPWLVRGGLAVLFTVSLVDLARDTTTLV